MGTKLDLMGKTFDRLTVIKPETPTISGHARWMCRCACGNYTIVHANSLQRGNTRSCGCLRSEQIKKVSTTHGFTKTPFYNVWLGMKYRCLDPKKTDFKYYGGRGIAVCDRWLDFTMFKEDMYNSYLEHKKDHKTTTIERKNNNGNYCLENCRWATRAEQAVNTRKNHIIKYQGKSQCISNWAKELGINYKVLWKRLQTHPPEIAFATQGR